MVGNEGFIGKLAGQLTLKLKHKIGRAGRSHRSWVGEFKRPWTMPASASGASELAWPALGASLKLAGPSAACAMRHARDFGEAPDSLR